MPVSTILIIIQGRVEQKYVGKLGLLPKRPVSLLRDPAATGSSSSPPAASFHPQPTTKLTEDDDDGLEYTQNPFEELEAPENK